MNSSGPSWSLAAFHARVKMSKEFHLFVITEGPKTDPYFYDQIAKTSSDKRVRSVKTYNVGRVTRTEDGQPGPGGKTAVIEAYKKTREAEALSVVNSNGRRSIVFCVDRDVDLKHKPYELDRNFLTTQMRDTEAELFVNADLTRALQNLLSLDHSDANSLVKDLEGWIINVARVWKDWIILGAIVANAKTSPPGNWSNASLINDKKYGPACRDSIIECEGRLIAVFGSKKEFNLAKCRARSILEENKRLRGEQSLIKGKWLPGWLGEIVGSKSSEKKTIARDSLLAISATTDFNASWTDYYREKFEQSMSRHLKR